MPVLDHEVHPLTRQGADAKYGCNSDRPRARSYWAPHRRVFPDGSFEVISVRVPDTMSEACRYDLAEHDSKCNGCQREKDVDYLNRMKNV